jgi:hypothetical protein
MNRLDQFYQIRRDREHAVRFALEARLRAHRRRLAAVAVLCLAGAFGLAVLTVLVLL